MNRIVFSAFAVAALFSQTIPHAIAQTQTEALVLQTEVSREVARATFVSAATLAAIQRKSDADLRRQRFEIEELRAEVEDLRATGAADMTALSRLHDELARRETAFVAELAAKDRAYAEEIAVYRRAVEDIAATPEGLAALVRFNEGDEAGALAVLDQLRAARDLAAARRIAQLALDARNRGASGVTTAEVVARYSEITRLDPQSFWDFVQLGRLLVDSGDLVGALRIAEATRLIASDDRERQAVLSELGNLQVMLGELPDARENYLAGAALAHQLAMANPRNAGRWLDFSHFLLKVGEVLYLQGDFEEASKFFQQSLGTVEMLVSSDPDNELLLSQLSISQSKAADALFARGMSSEALSQYQLALNTLETLATAMPDNVGRQLDLALALRKVGDALVAVGEMKNALVSYQRSLAVVEPLAKLDEENVRLQVNLFASLSKIAGFHESSGDLVEARRGYLLALDVIDQAASIQLSNVSLQLDLIAVLHKLSRIETAVGETIAATIYLRRAINLNTMLLERDPANVTWLRDRKNLEAELNALQGEN